MIKALALSIAVFLSLLAPPSHAREDFSVQTFEAKKEGSQALGVVVRADNKQAFLKSLRVFKQSVLEWRQKHGEIANYLQLTIIASPADYPELKSVLSQVYSSEQSLSPILTKIKFRVSLLDSKGDFVEDFTPSR